jgi:hypothetical protein
MTVTEDTWFIAHNGIDVFHWGFVPKDTQLDTGQPHLETFDNEEDWLTRKVELNILTKESEDNPESNI